MTLTAFYAPGGPAARTVSKAHAGLEETFTFRIGVAHEVNF